MPNLSNPQGLIPTKYLNGANWTGQANIYYIPSSVTTKLAIGDPVVSGGSADAKGVPSIARAADTGAIRGVIVGLGESPDALLIRPNSPDSIIRPAVTTKAFYALVVDDPNVLFEVQEAGVAPLAAADVGLNTNLTVVDAGDYFSKVTLDNADKATTATLQVKLFGLVRRIDNEFGANAKWLVKINAHELAAGTAGV